MITLRPITRGFHVVWPDETLTDALGMPGDFAFVIQNGTAPLVYGPKLPIKDGNWRGVWPTSVSLSGAVTSVNGYVGVVALTKTDLSLGNVDNTSDANKPVSTAQQTALDGKVTKNANITAATKTKITYDAKGLVTAGADATQDDIGDGSTYKQFSATEKTKLAGIATAATANQTDAYLLARANHTGTQAQSTVTSLVSDLAGKEPSITGGTTSQYWRGDKSWQTLDKSAVGLPNVDNTSDANKPVSTAAQTALNLKADDSSVVHLAGTEVITGAKTINDANFTIQDDADNTKKAKFEASGITTATTRTYTLPNSSGTIYVSGGTDVPVADGGTGRSTSSISYGIIAAGTTATGAHQTISPGTSGQFLKSAGASALASFAAITQSDVTNLVSDLALKAPLASPTFTGTVSGVTAAMVGLGNVNNTADSSKSVASAATLTTPRNIGGVAFNGSVDISLTSGSSMLKGNGSGGFSNAVAGTDYVGSTTVAKISQGTTAPSSPTTGDIWIDTN